MVDEAFVRGAGGLVHHNTCHPNRLPLSIYDEAGEVAPSTKLSVSGGPVLCEMAWRTAETVAEKNHLAREGYADFGMNLTPLSQSDYT